MKNWLGNLKPTSVALASKALRVFALCLFAGTASVMFGCASTQSAIRTLILEPGRFDAKQEAELLANRAGATADKVWLDTFGPQGHGSADYDRGFKEGFSDFMQFGGTGKPPSLPPRDYWQSQYQTIAGKRAIENWFAGFRHGAMLAKQNGFRDQVVVPMATVNQTYPATYGYYNELYPAIDVEHRDWHPATYADPGVTGRNRSNGPQETVDRVFSHPISPAENRSDISPSEDLQPQLNSSQTPIRPNPDRIQTEPLPSIIDSRPDHSGTEDDVLPKQGSGEPENQGLGNAGNEERNQHESLPMIQAKVNHYFPGRRRPYSGGPLIPPAVPPGQTSPHSANQRVVVPNPSLPTAPVFTLENSHEPGASFDKTPAYSANRSETGANTEGTFPRVGYRPGSTVHRK